MCVCDGYEAKHARSKVSVTASLPGRGKARHSSMAIDVNFNGSVVRAAREQASVSRGDRDDMQTQAVLDPD